MEPTNLKVSQHVKERYAERIMERDSKTSVAEFVATQEQKIIQDIRKMVEFGTVIYEGRSFGENNNQVTQVYLNGTWVVIVDPKSEKIVTLYSIDLGVGKEFNELYIGKMLALLEEAKKEQEEQVKVIDDSMVEYRKLIEQNDIEIAESRKIIRSLEEQNASYKQLIESSVLNKELAEKEVRYIIGKLIGKKG